MHAILQKDKVQLIMLLCQLSFSTKQWISILIPFDRCMSDVHCPVCLFFSCDTTIVTYHNEVENVTADNGNYNIKNSVTCKWNEQLREQYTLAFNIEEIENFIKNL